MKTKLLLLVLLCSCVFMTKAQAQNKKPEPPKVDMAHYRPPQDLSEFLKQNPSVARVYWKKNSTIGIELKNGKKEAYDLATKERKYIFLEKYGAIPKVPRPAN